jgi:Domain of unknown function (DUF4470)
MLRNNVLSWIFFFYAMGNTSAVNLTQDLPSEQDADVMLLSCGDVRSILFTTYMEQGMHLT